MLAEGKSSLCIQGRGGLIGSQGSLQRLGHALLSSHMTHGQRGAIRERILLETPMLPTSHSLGSHKLLV